VLALAQGGLWYNAPDQTSSLRVMGVSLLLRGRTGRWPIAGVRGHLRDKMRGDKARDWNRTHRLALVIGGRRILRGVVRWVVLAIVLWAILVVVLRVVLWVVQLWVVSLLCFLPVASRWGPPRRWLDVLVRVTLLLVLRDMNEDHVGPCDPPSAVHCVGEEDRKYDHETCDRDADTRSGAESVPANVPAETNVGLAGGQPRGLGDKRADPS